MYRAIFDDEGKVEVDTFMVRSLRKGRYNVVAMFQNITGKWKTKGYPKIKTWEFKKGRLPDWCQHKIKADGDLTRVRTTRLDALRYEKADTEKTIKWYKHEIKRIPPGGRVSDWTEDLELLERVVKTLKGMITRERNKRK